VNPTLEYLRQRHGRVSVQLYVSTNWPGSTFDELEEDNLAEVEDLIEGGELYVETPGSTALQ
jgi:hypothetical protein